MRELKDEEVTWATRVLLEIREQGELVGLRRAAEIVGLGVGTGASIDDALSALNKQVELLEGRIRNDR